MRHRTRGEEGQAAPALLAVTLAALAMAVGLFTLARGEEQSGRSDTAADAAALAAGKQWQTEAVMVLAASAMTPGIGGALTTLNSFQPTGGYLAAQQYAAANGGHVIGYQWIPGFSSATWTVQVQVEQNDRLPDGPEARSTSRVRVEAAGGICNAGATVGLVLRDHTCANPVRAALVCTPPTHATPNPNYVNCPSAAEIRAAFATKRTFVD